MGIVYALQTTLIFTVFIIQVNYYLLISSCLHFLLESCVKVKLLGTYDVCQQILGQISFQNHWSKSIQMPIFFLRLIGINHFFK